MGGVAVLHPQDCLKDHRHNLSSTPVKSRRNPKSSPNLTRSEGRKRSPPIGVRKNKTKAAMVIDPPAAAAAKTLVMGQVKILKRGEALDESAAPLKDLNHRNVTNATAMTPSPTIDFSGDRKVPRDSTGGRKLFGKKVSEKEKKSLLNSNAKIDDFALSSTDRLGPDPDMVPKQMKKDLAGFFFAGSGFVESPPPSSLPAPGFFTKNLVAGVKEDPSTDLRRILGLSLC